MKSPIFILYVADQEKSTRFYEAILGKAPILNVPGMTEFRLTDSSKLGLMPESGIAKIISPPAQDPKTTKGASRAELYLIVEDPQKELNKALAAGATFISNAAEKEWGDTVAYCMDPDGHIVAFAC